MTIEIPELSASYGRSSVLENLSFRLEPGTITALIGNNGAGKTTLVRCLTGEKRDYQGTILLDGKNAAVLSPRQRARLLSCLPQNLPCPHVTVRDLVLFGRTPYSPLLEAPTEADREAVELALRRTGMTPRGEEFVDRLSGGQLKKAFFAMILAQDTPLVILDEPTAHLDASSRFAFLELLRTLCHETQKTFLLILHDLPEVLQYADRILVLDERRICFDGDAQSCLAQKIPERIFGIRIHGSKEEGYAALPLK